MNLYIKFIDRKIFLKSYSIIISINSVNKMNKYFLQILYVRTYTNNSTIQAKKKKSKLCAHKRWSFELKTACRMGVRVEVKYDLY
jgi:hypothetical protein